MKCITKTFMAVVLVIICAGVCRSQPAWQHGSLTVTPDGHYLQFSDGTPFFWLGDTGWELFHRLTKEEATRYLENRRSKGFNVIQAVVLPEFDGLRKPNRYGDVPFSNLDSLVPNERYFRWIDTVIRIAQQKSLFIGLLPTWGANVAAAPGTGPALFNKEKAYAYGRWIGARYAAAPNIIWILGGDRPLVKDSNDWRPVWRAMAKGIAAGTQNKALMTYHPSGGAYSTSEYLQQEDWLSINMFQSGHGSGHDVAAWDVVTKDRNLLPVKPTLDAEPNYEDHPVNPWPKWDPANGYFRAYDVRKQLYRSVFAGACGVTYGHHAVWQFWSPREEKINYADRYWTEAIDRPGAFQAGYLRQLIESRSIAGRIPDQSMIVSGQGEKGSYMVAFRAEDSSYGMVYLPVGKPIAVDGSGINSSWIQPWWFNTRNGQAIKKARIKNSNRILFTPPEQGVEYDWVLVLDNPTHDFSAPGKK